MRTTCHDRRNDPLPVVTPPARSTPTVLVANAFPGALRRTRGLGELVVGPPRSLSWTISLLTPSRRMSYHTVYIHQPIHIVSPIVIGLLFISVSCRVYCVGRLGRDVQYHLLHLIPFVCTLTDLTQLTKRACE